MKTRLFILLAFILSTTLINAQDFTIDGINYTITDATEHTVEISEWSKFTGDLVLTTVNYNDVEYSITSIAKRAFIFSKLTSIILPNTIKSIGEYAFRNSYALTSVILPNTLTIIEPYTFIHCNNLKSIIIPNSVTSIDNYAFGRCTGITDITIPDSVTSIGAGAFDECINLERIAIPDSVTSIGAGAFNACHSLQNVILPNKILTIGDNTFNACFSLQNFTLPITLTSIGESAFMACYSLNKIIFPETLTNIGDLAFSDCTALQSVISNKVEPITINANVFDNLVLSNILLKVPTDSELTYKNADVWKSFGTTLFENSKLFTVNNINYTITDVIEHTVEISAGSRCSGNVILTTVFYNSIEYTITSIADKAFYQNLNVTSITIPDSVISIGNESFRLCSNLTYVYLSKTLRSIGERTFYQNFSLKNITIPDTVISIGNESFGNCSNLRYVYLSETLKSIGEGAFTGCSELIAITLPNSVSSIGNESFYSCTKLENVTLPNTLTSIGEGAFKYCSSLTSVTLPNSVISIGNSSFSQCPALTTVISNQQRPTAIVSTVFDYLILSELTLVVPTGSKSAYEAAAVWQNFGTIVEEGNLSTETNFTAKELGLKISNSNLEIINKGDVEINNLQILNLLGGVVKTSPNTNIDISSLPKGVYILYVSTNKGVATKKFIKAE